MNTFILRSSLLALAATVVGCANTPEKIIDADAGQSVAQMISGQTLDPSAAAHPAPLAPATGDGQRLRAAVEQYHKDVPKLEEKISRPIQFESGGSAANP